MRNTGIEKYRALPKGMELEEAERKSKNRQCDPRAHALKLWATGNRVQ